MSVHKIECYFINHKYMKLLYMSYWVQLDEVGNKLI